MITLFRGDEWKSGFQTPWNELLTFLWNEKFHLLIDKKCSLNAKINCFNAREWAMVITHVQIILSAPPAPPPSFLSGRGCDTCDPSQGT